MKGVTLWWWGNNCTYQYLTRNTINTGWSLIAPERHLEIGSTLFQAPKKKAIELPALFEDLGQAANIVKLLIPEVRSTVNSGSAVIWQFWPSLWLSHWPRLRSLIDGFSVFKNLCFLVIFGNRRLWILKVLKCVRSWCYLQSGNQIRKTSCRFLVFASPDQLTCCIDFLRSAYRFNVFLLDSVFYVVEMLTIWSSLCILLCSVIPACYPRVTALQWKGRTQVKKTEVCFRVGVLLLFCFYSFNTRILTQHTLLLCKGVRVCSLGNFRLLLRKVEVPKP